MKIKHLEYIRALLLGSSVVTTALTNSEIVDLEQVSSVLMASYNLSLLTGFHLEQLTRDYEEIDGVYRLIVGNIAELVEVFNIQDDPVKVFALFVYLYRSGFLSYGKDFTYSFDMKDLARLNGVDVVRGTGVCRSISSMFTDVCNYVGLTAANVSVKVSSKCLEMKEQLSPVDLKSVQKNKKIVRIVSAIMSPLPLANHLVTVVSDGKHAGVFDPTNDIYMNMRRFGKYEFINNTGATMSYKSFSNLMPLIFGQMQTKFNLFELHKYSKMNKLTYEEYKKSYREVLELIKANPQFLEAFYNLNQEYYEILERLTREQHGMIKRMIPIIPNKRKK